MSRVLELKIARWKVADLKPHPKNPRKHPKKGTPRWEALRQSLDHDYFDPLVVNVRNGMLVSGHFRRTLLSDMGVEAADVVEKDYDEPTHLARMIAANRQAGEFEEELLAGLAKELEAAGLAAGDHFVIEGSANLRSSDNLEQIAIFNDAELADFHRGWMAELAERTPDA